MSLENSILMSVGGLTLDPVTKTPIVILKDRDNKLNLPIWIGLLEATAMATELEGIKMARPMTHDLLRNVLDELGATVECIEITDLKENTYFALIHLLINGARRTIDSRPSDAISLALRTKSPIYVDKRVIETSSVLQQAEEANDTNLSNVSRDKWAEILEKMSPDDFKYKMRFLSRPTRLGATTSTIHNRDRSTWHANAFAGRTSNVQTSSSPAVARSSRGRVTTRKPCPGASAVSPSPSSPSPVSSRCAPPACGKRMRICPRR